MGYTDSPVDTLVSRKTHILHRRRGRHLHPGSQTQFYRRFIVGMHHFFQYAFHILTCQIQKKNPNPSKGGVAGFFFDVHYF